ncbi:hypothetical protein PR048_014973 [Dryococelus australis]|uniref:Uncharacterized protein n=1 Tax=Dryococelus australis TaxID=614101 RepID=A0ABQ9HGJ4_9NEOP|nr:hypothetical protein PR048_014973 [Dryococelus australis]
MGRCGQLPTKLIISPGLPCAYGRSAVEVYTFRKCLLSAVYTRRTHQKPEWSREKLNVLRPLTRERRGTHYTRAVTSNAPLRSSGRCVKLANDQVQNIAKHRLPCNSSTHVAHYHSEVIVKQRRNERAWRENWRSPRKPADQRYCQTRFPHAKFREQPGRGIEPVLPWWMASCLTTKPPRPPTVIGANPADVDCGQRKKSSGFGCGIEQRTTSEKRNELREKRPAGGKSTNASMGSANSAAGRLDYRTGCSICCHRHASSPIVQPVSRTLHCLILAVADFPSAGHFSRCSSPITRNSATHSLSTTQLGGLSHFYIVHPDLKSGWENEVGIVLNDASGRRVFSGISHFPSPCIPALLYIDLASPASALKKSILKATQIPSLT